MTYKTTTLDGASIVEVKYTFTISLGIKAALIARWIENFFLAG